MTHCGDCRVRRALENTSLPIDESKPESTLTYGRGLMQVNATISERLVSL